MYPQEWTFGSTCPSWAVEGCRKTSDSYQGTTLRGSYQGTTSGVPQVAEDTIGFSRWGLNFSSRLLFFRSLVAAIVWRFRAPRDTDAYKATSRLTAALLARR